MTTNIEVLTSETETQKFLPWWFDFDPTTNPFMRDHKLRYHVVHYKESETESSLPGNWFPFSEDHEVKMDVEDTSLPGAKHSKTLIRNIAKNAWKDSFTGVV